MNTWRWCAFGLGARFPLPEQAESHARPTQEDGGLENEQGLFPRPHAAGQQEQPEPLAAIWGRSFHLAVENRKLVAPQGVLGDEFGFGVGEVGSQYRDRDSSPPCQCLPYPSGTEKEPSRNTPFFLSHDFK